MSNKGIAAKLVGPAKLKTDLLQNDSDQLLARKPLGKLLRAVNTRPRKSGVPSVMATPPTITVAAAYGTFSMGASSVSITVDMNSNNQYYHMLNRSQWSLVTTYNTVNFYKGPQNGNTDAGATTVIAFRHNGRRFGIYDRINNNITVLVNGELVSATPINTGTGTGISVVPITIDFGSYDDREIVIISRTPGFGAIRIDAGDTISPIDLTEQPRVSAMTDSYGAGSTPYLNGNGPYGAAALRLGMYNFNISAEGGSGFTKPGNAGHTFLDTNRVACLLYGTPDLIRVAGGINDGNATAAEVGVAAANLFGQIRAACPQSVISVIAPWCPPSSTISFAQARRDSILAALQSVGGLWYHIDTTNSTWLTSNGKTGLIGPAGGPWQSGDGQATTLTADLVAATSATLSSTWARTTGTYNIIFSDGTVKSVTLTNGSASVSWTGAVTATANIGVYTSTAGNSVRFINSTDLTHFNPVGFDYAGALIAQADISCIRALSV